MSSSWSLQELTEFVKGGRAIGKEEYTLRKKLLPAAQFSGNFGFGRRSFDFREASGLVALDFDNLPDINESMSVVADLRHTVFAHQTTSGRGLHVVVEMATPWWSNAADYQAAWMTAAIVYAVSIGSPVDASTRGLTQLQFLSFDPTAYTPNSWEAVLPLQWENPPRVPASLPTKNIPSATARELRKIAGRPALLTNEHWVGKER